MDLDSRLSIAVDARPLHSWGIGRYIREILRGILTRSPFEKVLLLGDARQLEAFVERAGGGQKTIEYLPHAGGLYSPRSQAFWLGSGGRSCNSAHVTFFPHYDAPFYGLPARSVVTVHDLIHFKLPDLFPAWKRAVAGRLLDRVVRRARRVVVVSEATHRDLIERLPGAAPKVRTIPQGVGEPFLEDGTAAESSDREPFVLCVGNRPHKNLATAIEAFAAIRMERPDLRMVIVGSNREGAEIVRARSSMFGVSEHIEEVPSPSDMELRDFYRRCSLLLFPSVYEGFGLPVLEAMACGAPVIASSTTSLPEVVGDAGLLVNPHSARQIADAVRRVLDEPGVARELATRGRERARRFTWESTSDHTIELLVEVASGVPNSRGPVGVGR